MLKQNLGEIGWVAKGKLRPELDTMIFGLESADIWRSGRGRRTQAPGTRAGCANAENTLEEATTRKLPRCIYIHAKLNDYVVKLRKNDFDVEA